MKKLVEGITAEEVESHLKDGKAQSIIDVRENEEVEQGKIPGSFHIALGQLEERLHEIDSSKEHIMVCRSGSRSGMA